MLMVDMAIYTINYIKRLTLTQVSAKVKSDFFRMLINYSKANGNLVAFFIEPITVRILDLTDDDDNDVSFELDDWNHIEEYALNGLYLEDELSQDEQKPAAILTKNPSVSPSAIPHKKPSAEPVAIQHENTAIIPPEKGKNDDDIDEDERKPAAN